MLYQVTNQIRPQLQFNVELECDRVLKFSDLSITIYDNGLEFNMYHKPTYTAITTLTLGILSIITG
jgi:hypothetical protein